MITNTLIAIPLKSELSHVISTLQENGIDYQQRNLGRQAILYSHQLNAAFAVAGHGKTQFAIQTQYLISQIPGIIKIIGLGSAGALHTSLKVGDVIIGEKSVEHDYKERFTQKSVSEVFADAELVSKLRLIKSESYDIHVGSIASGDENIISAERGQEIINSTQALAVAWEGAGLARVAKFNQVPFCEVRAITDNADHNTVQSFNENLSLAMKNASDLVIRYLHDQAR